MFLKHLDSSIFGNPRLGYYINKIRLTKRNLENKSWRAGIHRIKNQGLVTFYSAGHPVASFNFIQKF